MALTKFIIATCLALLILSASTIVIQSLIDNPLLTLSLATLGLPTGLALYHQEHLTRLYKDPRLIDELLASAAKNMAVYASAGFHALGQLPFWRKDFIFVAVSQMKSLLYRLKLRTHETTLTAFQGIANTLCASTESWMRMIIEPCEWICKAVSIVLEGTVGTVHGVVYTCWYVFALSFHDFITGRLYLKMALNLFLGLLSYISGRYQHHQHHQHRLANAESDEAGFSLKAMGWTALDLFFWVLCVVGACVVVYWILPSLLPFEILREIEFLIEDVWDSSLPSRLMGIMAVHGCLGVAISLKA